MKTINENQLNQDYSQDDFYHELCVLLDDIIKEDNTGPEPTVEALGWKELQVQQVVQKIEKAMKQKNISEAERLRKMLFKIDVTATSAIYKSGQLIEEAKLMAS